MLWRPEARDRLQEHGLPRRVGAQPPRTPDTRTGSRTPGPDGRTPARGRQPRKRRDGRVLTSGSGQSHGRRRVRRRPHGRAGHCFSDRGIAGCGATAGHRWRTPATDGTQPADTLDADTPGSPTAADHRALARMAHLDCGGGYGAVLDHGAVGRQPGSRLPSRPGQPTGMTQARRRASPPAGGPPRGTVGLQPPCRHHARFGLLPSCLLTRQFHPAARLQLSNPSEREAEPLEG